MANITAVTATIICQPTLKLAFASVREFVPGAAIHVFMPEAVRHKCTTLSNERVAWHDLTPSNPNVRAQYSPRYWYSVFMTSETLWEMFSTPYVLVFQADTLVCRPLDLRRFEEARYDYIGGPSLRYGGRITPVPWDDLRRPLGAFLNGGVALHRREWTRACAKKLARANLNEDAKWNRCGYTPVTALDAMSFGSDNGFTLCFTHEGTRRCPSVVHKPWSGHRVRRLGELLHSCPRLDDMRRAWRQTK